ncbi:hypothetical protein [Fibrobacter sp.]|uniref:hypothetical protein n=1 Tax=Fibrobacter sp. TaxID=35828 RepID=UPI00386B2D35
MAINSTDKEKKHKYSKYPGLTPAAYTISKNESDKRKRLGLSSSIRAVVSEAVVKVYGNAK